MKKLLGLLILLISTITFANGVGVIDASNATYLKILSSNVDVYVENQVAITTATMTFKNTLSYAANFKFAFPMPPGASATELSWKINGNSYTAQVGEIPQDTTLPGGTINYQLQTYLGATPLFFAIPQSIGIDSTTEVTLTYVELLKYEFGEVSYMYPNDYMLIQTAPLDLQQFDFNLTSARTIENIQMLSHSTSQLNNNGNEAHVLVSLEQTAANANYELSYTLSLNQLGLFDFSTKLPSSLVPDTLGNGFFVFVAEPDPSNTTNVIDKVFTLIIDRSGSMGGEKIVQARNAAKYIVNNLNEGDRFNIVDFETNVYSFSNEHVPFNNENKTAALAYIDNIFAGGATNISGAFSTAIPQFSSASDSTANIIIFFTDGQPTVGILDVQGILNHVQDLVNQTENVISLFCFGIGTDANQQLLTQLAANNYGIAEFLGNDELEARITRFYLTIRNPVLLNTQIEYPEGTLSEVFPNPLPNLYKGQQMIVSGRYNTGGDVNIILKGTAFGQDVQYQYPLNLSDTIVQQYHFLPKIWAKQKIENLMVQYFSLDPNSTQAQNLKSQIIALSIAYGVITDFTSFTGGFTGVEEEVVKEKDLETPKDFVLLGNYPNPFNPSTIIRFNVGSDIYDMIVIKIFNALGELVRVLTIHVNGSGAYEVMWDGRLMDGAAAPSGMYIYTLEYGNYILSNKMILMK